MLKVKYYLPPKALLTIYKSILLPHVSYCNIVWGSFKSKNHLILLQQKKAIRLCAGVGYYENTNPIFNRFKTLKIDDIHILQLALFMYRFHSRQLPLTFTRMFQLNSVIHKYPTRSSTNFHLLNPVTALAHKSIRHAGPDTWNTIPPTIRNASTLIKFKFAFKQSILSRYLL